MNIHATKVKDLRRSAVGFFPTFGKCFMLLAAAFQASPASALSFLFPYPHTPDHFLEDHPVWGN